MDSDRSFEKGPADVRTTPGASPLRRRDDFEPFHLSDEELRQETEHLNEVLRRRIEEIETIFDVVPIGLAIADDPHCRTVRVNPALAHMFGVDPSTNISMVGPDARLLPFRMLRHGVPILPQNLPLHRAARRGEDVEMTLDVETEDGRQLTVWQAARPLYNADGDVSGAVMVMTDVTSQTRDAQIAGLVVRASEVLASSFDLSKTLTMLGRLLVPGMTDLYAVDLVDEMGEAVRAASRMISPAAGSETVMPPTAPLHDMPEHPANEVLRTGVPFLADGRDSAIAERLAQRADLLAQWRTLNLRSLIIAPMETRGRILGVMTFATIGDRRHFDRRDLAAAVEIARRAATAVDNARLLDSAERAMEDAQRANRTKSDFLAAMSHELRTPLNAIAGYCQLMLLGLRGEVTDGQRDDLLRIEQNQRHLLGLINSILNFAKLDAGIVQYDLAPTAVADLFESVASMIAPQMETKGVTFVQKPCPPELCVLVDRDKARQILLNLLSNAFKFTPAGGTVTLGCRTTASHATIYVRDTGVGIPRAKLARVFDPFVQVGRTLSTVHEGVGLGLAISRDLARGMDGDIRVASEEGHGSIFSVAFPLVAEA
jgi:signal transduction histidine kinase/PAS domain-containing protein